MTAVVPEHDTPAVRMCGVVKRFGDRAALDGLDLTVDRRSCTALLGPNGAGKTTTMRILVGQLAPSDGLVEIFGHPQPAGRRAVRSRIGLVPQADNLESELSVRDNLDIYARFFGIGRVRRRANIEHALAVTKLEERAGSVVGTLSGGYRRRALIARSLVSQPDLLILDEPTVGLDVEVRLTILDTLGRIKAAGASIVVASHYIDELSTLTDVVTIIRAGRAMRASSVTELGASFAEYRSVVAEGALAVRLARLATHDTGQVIPLSTDDTRFVVRIELLEEVGAADADHRELTLSEMYLAGLHAS